MLNEEFAAASNWVAAMSQEDLRAEVHQPTSKRIGTAKKDI